jgi:hypothetical protein
MQLLHGEPPHFGRVIRLRAEMVFFGARLNGASQQFIFSKCAEMARNARLSPGSWHPPLVPVTAGRLIAGGHARCSSAAL